MDNIDQMSHDSKEWDHIAQALDRHPHFKVLKRLAPEKWLHQTPANENRASRLKGVILDTETTGMNSLSDKVIELGMIAFEYDPQLGQIIHVDQVFDQLEDPGFPIPPESIAIHHITDEMVKGHRIHDQEVIDALQGVSLVIAHNAAFDRPFVENRWPIFAQLPWACSIKDIDWRFNSFGSAKLEYLAMTQGIFYEAHRAETDCWALLEVLNMVLPKTKQSAIQTLFESSTLPQSKVYATASPFETKDVLKARGYRWSADIKCWSKVVSSSEKLKDELLWLKHHVYGQRKGAKVEIETLSSKERHSERIGTKYLQDLSAVSETD
jgi:DNA polymerase III subunit epsilon